MTSRPPPDPRHAERTAIRGADPLLAHHRNPETFRDIARDRHRNGARVGQCVELETAKGRRRNEARAAF
jgi:hypothetical protein